MTAILGRRYDKNQTFGKLYILKDDECIFHCNTLELKWMGNIRNISCIPEGHYHVEKMLRPNGKPGLWIKDVPNRTAILIHLGNFAVGDSVDIQGCILVGDGYKDVNGDGHLDIVNSTDTFEKLFDIVEVSFDLIIT